MRPLLLLSVLLLAACEYAMFRHAPTAAGEQCPAGLAGDWQDQPGQEEPELRVSIDGDCMADIRMLDAGAWVEARARLLFLGDHLFVDASEVAAIASTDTEEPIPDGYFAWKVVLSEERLELADPDARRLAHLIIDRKIKGRLRKDEGLEVMVTEPPETMADMLDRHRPFNAETAITLHRASVRAEPLEE